MASGFSAPRAALVLVAVTLLLLTISANALEVVNKRSCDIVVFAPPICQPCKCPQIQCIREPCEQPPCFCTAVCKYVPGVTVKSKTKATISVGKEYFPLQFLTVEIKEVAYVVAKADLPKISSIAVIVVRNQTCGKGKMGIRADVYPNPKFSGSKHICLMRGERYGT